MVSSPEGSPGEVQQPDLAAVMQVVEERLHTVESGMVNIRRTLNRHSYRLGFIQRGMVQQRNMLQRSMRPRQHRGVRRRAQQLGCGVPEAASQDSPPARGEEVGAYPNTPVITRYSGDDRCQGIFSAPMDCKAEASS
ncbi:UNVERIFIED_CONTAM: hypothetical protein K2H54_040518 [Gekko kuhli]